MTQAAIQLYDTTLRDGAQGPRVKFSPDDQIKIVRELDALGIHFIEGGWPASNPKAQELFVRCRDLELENASLTAFGSTCHPKYAPEDDPNLAALIETEAPITTIFSKSSPLHATQVLRITLEKNIELIRQSVSFLADQGRRVFLDAEHFFDAYKADSAYALATLEAGHAAGAEIVILCDTNGGCLPWEIEEITKTVITHLPGAPIGIHTHNDSGCGAANALAGIRAGAVHVQGTINGYGERTGNANLIPIIAGLQLKMGLHVVTPEQLARLTHLSHLVAEFANLAPNDADPYVGRDAFTHKAGIHANAVTKVKESYEHIDPSLVGNRTTISVSEMAGRSNLQRKAAEFGIKLDREGGDAKAVLARIKDLESEGYEFEAADASLKLLIMKTLGRYESRFELLDYRVSVATVDGQGELSEGTVKVKLPDGSLQHTVAEGHGPVDALNQALRKALMPTYPALQALHLEDYKVRILDAKAATAATTRVLITSSDEDQSWDTIGVSENIITASCQALLDSIEYKLMIAHEG